MAFSKMVATPGKLLENNNTPTQAIESGELLAQKVKQARFASAIKMTTLATALALSSITPQKAQAQSEETLVLVVDSKPIASEEWTGSSALQGFKDDIAESESMTQEEKDKINFAISDVVRMRQAGIEFYGEFLAQFEQLSKEDQYQVALAIDGENGQGGSDMTDEMLNLVRDGRITEKFIQAILEEATINGADEFFELPGFEDTLNDFRINGFNGKDSIGYVIEKAPINGHKIYLVVASIYATIENEAVTAELEAVSAENEAVTAELDAEEERGRDLDRIGAQLDRILGQQDKILGNK
ncbi:hypothetical protein GW846_06030 [Candidatus Gracilibacteria bacterium]|nr:hypothetical protein [Candidatus Gracilibacteria bacterium]